MKKITRYLTILLALSLLLRLAACGDSFYETECQRPNREY